MHQLFYLHGLECCAKGTKNRVFVRWVLRGYLQASWCHSRRKLSGLCKGPGLVCIRPERHRGADGCPDCKNSCRVLLGTSLAPHLHHHHLLSNVLILPQLQARHVWCLLATLRNESRGNKYQGRTLIFRQLNPCADTSSVAAAAHSSGVPWWLRSPFTATLLLQLAPSESR